MVFSFEPPQFLERAILFCAVNDGAGAFNNGVVHHQPFDHYPKKVFRIILVVDNFDDLCTLQLEILHFVFDPALQHVIGSEFVLAI